mgnify:CR=1 FL=1
MLEFLVGLMLYAFWTAVIINFVVLFGMRIFFVWKEKKTPIEMIKILFIPFSIGYLSLNKRRSVFDLIYKVFLIIMFFATGIGGVMVFYTHFA